MNVTRRQEQKKNYLLLPSRGNIADYEGNATKKHSKKRKSKTVNGKKVKNIRIFLVVSSKSRTFAPAFERLRYKVDPLAQSVEHNTFNVGVLGSSPKRITKENPQEVEFQ